MKKFTSALGGMLIAMFFVAFISGCGQHAMANPLAPPDPVLNPTPVVTPGVTPGVTPTVTHNWYATVQGASAATFTFCSGAWDTVSAIGACSGSASLVSPSFLMTGTTYAVPQTWSFYLQVTNSSATETWSVKIYKDGVLQGTLSLPPGTSISQSF